MADAFDPYYKWLGIPPKDQPPNHYRLLAIELFEPDSDVIDAAANRLMGYVQEFANGPHVAESQKLLNEISAARVCLLNSQRKAEYDHRLRAEQLARSKTTTAPKKVPVATPLLSPAPPPRPVPPPARHTIDTTAIDEADLPKLAPITPINNAAIPSLVTSGATPSGSAAERLAARKRKPQPSWVVPAALGGCVLLVGVVALAVVFGGHSREPSSTNKVPVDSVASVPTQSDPHTPPKPAAAKTSSATKTPLPPTPRRTNTQATAPVQSTEPSATPTPPPPSKLRLPAGQTQVSVKLKPGGGLLFADVTINGRSVPNCICDTGLGYVAIHDKTADELALPQAEFVTVRSVAGRQDLSMRRVRTLVIGDAALDDVQVAAVDLSAWEQTLGVPVGGLIGYDVWSQIPFTLDYAQATVTFHDRAAFQPPAGAIEGTLTITDKQPFVPGWVQSQDINGQWLLATGMQGAAVLMPGRDAGVREEGAKLRKTAASGAVEMRQVFLPAIGLSARSVQNVWVSVAETPLDVEDELNTLGALGCSALKYCQLTCDYYAGRMWLVQPGQTTIAANQRDLLQLQPLMLWCQEGDLGSLRQVLSAAGKLLEEQGPQGDTPLRIAAARGYANIVQALLDVKANVNAINARRETPLMAAVQAAHEPTVQALLTASADPNLRAEGGLTALLIAARQGNQNLVEALLAQKADVNQANEAGNTPLMVAAWQGHTATVDALLAAKADPQVKNKAGVTALQLAESNGHASAAAALKRAGAK